MGFFKNAQESYEHTQFIRDLLYHYDTFLDSIEVVADFGCGEGLNVEWWADVLTRDDPPEPRNYLCYAVDRNTSRIKPHIASKPNVKVIQENLEHSERFIPRQIDLIWCHDTFQYMTDPIGTLRRWNEMMSINGMLILSIPQCVYYQYNRLQTLSYNGFYFNHNAVNMMYMLAVNGFDCRDAYFYKKENDPWLYIAVYKSDLLPMDPQITSWHDIIELKLVNDSLAECMNKYGYIKQDEIITTWLDKDFYKIRE